MPRAKLILMRLVLRAAEHLVSVVVTMEEIMRVAAALAVAMAMAVSDPLVSFNGC